MNMHMKIRGMRALAALTLALALLLGAVLPAGAESVGWQLGDEEEVTPAPTSEVLPTARQAATDTPAPTETPIVATPMPTATPIIATPFAASPAPDEAEAEGATAEPQPEAEAAEPEATLAPNPTAEPAVTLVPNPTAEPDLTLAPTATPEPTATPVPTPIPAAAIADDGMVRVYLKSLGDPSRLTLTFAGVYAVDGTPAMRFARDMEVTLVAGDGSVYLQSAGLTLDLGPAVTFTRYAASEGADNGLFIAEASKPNLYCGDLTVSAGQDGLVPVLRLNVEDYLYGVVAYEMSDSFPLEALKAQSVAARTYALQHKRDAGDRGYDLVDTPSDQVFHGFDPQYIHVIAAVDATRGIVGLANGTYATCYYTASNGGQTALASQAWGRADDDGYLAMKDDPYDLDNPRSLRSDITVKPNFEGSEVLKIMLTEALEAPMAQIGYGTGDWRLESIAAIRPSNPKAPGSRWYQGLDFDVNMSVQVVVAAPRAAESTPTATPEASATPEAGAEASATAEAAEAPIIRKVWLRLDKPVTVTLDTYSQIKANLNLGLNKSDYELVTVETTTDDSGAPASFKIIMRRYGHGVGMSQRGAQWMASHYNMDFGQILNFYYPGLSFQRMNLPRTALPVLPALSFSSAAASAVAAAPTPTPVPTPTPAPLPAPIEGERLARVELESAGSMLNVRETADINGRVVATLATGREVLVSGEEDEDGWIAIRTAEFSGYVRAEYLVVQAN